MKRLLILIAILLLILTTGCQPSVDKTAGATERPLPANPRFASLMEPPAQEDQGGPLPSFIVTDFAETRSADTWEISGVIRQETAVPGLNFDRLIIVFQYEDGRDCEWRPAEHGPLEGLVQPVSFNLVLRAADYVDSGFGFEDLADFQGNAQVSAVVVQADHARYYVKSGGKYIARFVVPVEGGK